MPPGSLSRTPACAGPCYAQAAAAAVTGSSVSPVQPASPSSAFSSSLPVRAVAGRPPLVAYGSAPVSHVVRTVVLRL
jgi:hypothetical protein